MKLEQLLKQETKRAAKLALMEKEAEKDFIKASRECFDTFIIPTLNEVVQIFKENKFKAIIGQERILIAYDTSALTYSITLCFREYIMQLDAVACLSEKKVILHATYPPAACINNKTGWPVEQMSSQKVMGFVEANIKAMMDRSDILRVYFSI